MAETALQGRSSVLDSPPVEPPTLPSSELPVTIIEPSSGWRALDLREVWRFRELIYFLAWRDVKVRYKQTALGVAWAVLQPLVAMAIFTLFLGRVVQVPLEGVPYTAFVYAGLVPWMYFANATTNASSSLVSNTNLISKVYFPRLVIPLAGVAAGLVDLGINLVILLVILLLTGTVPGMALLALPFLAAMMVLTALAVSIWLSALDVQYRDVRYAIPFLVQVWMFATPVVYPATVLPERFRAFYGLNPMAGVVEGFRWALLGRTDPPGPLLAVSFAVVVGVLFSGLFYFRRMERTFADIV